MRMVIVDKFKQFCEHCTLHGLYYFYQTSSLWLHCIWLIVISSATCLCAYLSHMIWEKFVANPTFTVVESTHYSMDNILFPAVTVCISNIVYGPHTDNITRILNLRGYDQEQINNFYDSFENIKNIDYVAENYVKEMHAALDQIGYSYNNLLKRFSNPCHVLIQECMWRSKPIECSIMFRKVFTVMGYCCQFDVNYFRKQAENNTKFEAGEEASEALDITVNTQTILANGSYTHTFASVYVYDSQNKLTLLDCSITLNSASYFDVTVAVWAIDSSDDVKTLSLSNRKCFLSEDTKKDADSYQGCITLYIMQKVVTQCRCLPFYYESSDLDVEDFPSCTWERLRCIYNMLDKVQSQIRYIISQRECYQKCDYVQYETKTTYINRETNDDDVDSHESRVAVHFADSTCIKYRREVLYTWDQMLANLGGIFGLCLGGSIVSLIELLWFLLELLFTVMGSQWKKAGPNKGKGKEIFTLTKIKPRDVFNSEYPYIN